MVSSTTSAVTSIALVVLVSLSGAYAFVALGGVPSDRLAVSPVEDPDTVLVRFPDDQVQITTKELAIGSDGHLVIDGFHIPFTNITAIDITMHTNMSGITASDRFELAFRAPNDDNRTGSAEGPTSMNGYRASQLVVSHWGRAAQPSEEHHTTDDAFVALGRAAANHTDLRSTGEWRLELRLTPPGAPLAPREGKVMFTFVLTRYDGIAYPGEVRGGAPMATDDHA